MLTHRSGRTAALAVVACVGWLTCVSAKPAVAQESADSAFQKGFFLQTHERDLAAAAAQFERVAADESAPQAVRQEARLRLAHCREDLASADLARLMPPDAIAYAEFTNPGRHVRNVLSMLGLMATPKAGDAADPPQVTRIERGVYFPDDFSISPELVAELEKIKGIAAAVTSVSPRGEPDGLIAIHPGDSGLLRGSLETAVQVLKPEEPIGGFRTYRVEQEDVLITVTARVVLVARSREQLQGAVSRLTDPAAESLASQPNFQKVQADREAALLFAYVDGPRAYKMLEPRLHGRDAAMARSLLDLEHLNSFSASLKSTGQTVEARLQFDLDEAHRNLVYSLVRTAPLTRRSLNYVPGDAAAVAVIGLNPGDPEKSRPAPTEGQGSSSTNGQPQASLMDLGREVFSNIEELSLFVLPSESAQKGIPNVGLVLAVKDPARSEALWNQLLSLPALVVPQEVPAPAEIEIGGQPGREYRFPDAPPLVVLKVDDASVIAGTRSAVEAAVNAKSSGTAVTHVGAFQPLVSTLTPDCSKAILVHVGRAIETALHSARGREADDLQKARALVGELKLLIVTDEQPARFTLRAAVSDLPHLPTIVKLLGEQGEANLSRTTTGP